MTDQSLAAPLLAPDVVVSGRARRASTSAGMSLRPLLLVGASALGIVLLLPQVGRVGPAFGALARAHWQWLPTIVACSMLTYLMGALALTGASPSPLPMGRTVTAQLAAAFTNRLAPAGLGGMATNVRFLELGGSTRTAATAAVVLNSACGFIVHLAAALAVVPLLGGSPAMRMRGPDVSDYWPAATALVIVVVFVGVVVSDGATLGRARLTLGTLTASVVSVVRTPWRLAALLLGSLGVTAGYALALVASVQAFGGGVTTVRVVAVYLGASALAAVSPTPGGLGTLEAAMVAGLVAIGAAGDSALGAVLVFRLVTYWLPVLPGWLAFRSLRAEGSL